MQDGTLEERKERIIAQYGPWTAHNIALDEQTSTLNRAEPISRIRARQYLQVIRDTLRVPFSDLRVLDLGCLEGGFSIELAAQGAEVVGIDARAAHIAKANFAKETLGLARVTFVEDDIRRISPETYGTFDVILCLGLLYHLDQKDLLPFVRMMSRMCRTLCILDTHISLRAVTSFTEGADTYHGRFFTEHYPGDSDEKRQGKLWASADNAQSFWLTEASLLNALVRSGFTSVHACLHPSIITTGPDRKMYAALKGEPVTVRRMSPKSVPEEFELHHYEEEKNPFPGRPVFPDEKYSSV